MTSREPDMRRVQGLHAARSRGGPARLGQALAATLIAVASVAQRSAAQCQEWVAGYECPGFDDGVRDAKWLDAGTGPALFVVRNVPPSLTPAQYNVHRWDGARWSVFGIGSTSWLASTIDALDLGGGPELWSTGAPAGTNGASSVARWNGGSWSALPGVFAPGVVPALAAFDDGSGRALYLGGGFQVIAGVPASGVARWNGTSWSALGTGMSGSVNRLVVFDDGSGAALYASGTFTQAGGVPAPRVARWNGTAWSAVGASTVPDVVSDLRVVDDGGGPALHLAGTATGLGASLVARWNGSAWSPVGAPPGHSASAVAGYDDGTGKRLHAFVAARSPAGDDEARVVQWTGATWVPVGVEFTTRNGPARPSGLAASPLASGDLVAFGQFLRNADAGAHDLARWNGTTWGPIGGGLGIGGQVDCSAVHDDGTGDALYVGGWFQTAGGITAENVARFDGRSWSRVGRGLLAPVRALASHDDGTGRALYAGNPTGISRWNGTTWSSTTPTWTSASVGAFAVCDLGSGAELYAVASLTSGTSTLSGVLRWDGVQWSQLPAQPAGSVRAIASHDDGSGAALYCAAGTGVARWNGTAWTVLSTNTPGITAFAVHDDGTGRNLFGAGASGIYRSNGTTWSTLPWPSASMGLSLPLALASHADETGNALYVAGTTTGLAPGPAYRIARWNGTSWSALGVGIGNGPGSAEPVRTLASYDAGSGHGAELYAAGTFTAAGGRAAGSFARWGDCAHATAPGGAATPAFANAGVTYCAGDGSATPCPCGNGGMPMHGCASSQVAAGARLDAEGVESVASDTIVLTASGIPPGVAVTFLQSTLRENAGLGIAAFDGLRCLDGTVVRISTKYPTGGSAVYPEPFDVPLSIAGALLPAGGVRHYQAQYRDPNASFCTPSAVNWTNGLTLVWRP